MIGFAGGRWSGGIHFARRGVHIKPANTLHGALAAILGTLLVLVAAEVVTRRWIASPSVTVPDGRYGWAYPPGARIVHSSEGWSESRTNSMGLLDDELRTPRARVRAVLLGDSFAEALQVARRDNFSSVAERGLPGLEVVNASFSGRSPVEYADWIEEYGPQLTPDIVVVELNDGDLADLLLPASQARLAAAAGRAEGAPRPTVHEGVGARMLRRVLRSSALVTVAWHRVKPLSTEWRAHPPRPFRQFAARSGAPPASPAGDPRLPGLVDALHRRIAAHSRRVLYLYIPGVDYFGPRPGYADPRAAAFFHAFAARNHVTLVDPLDDILAEFARTGQPLQGFANSVLGRGHLNAAGHRVLGARLARAIAGELR
jgi:hypothetical protein